MKTWKLACVFLVIASSVLRGQETQTRKVTTVEGISEYRLANGLRVLLFPDNSVSTVTVNLTVFVGSRHEGYGETGMAHLLEHMVFKGTPTFRDVPKSLRDHGASYNGSTWVDRTNYYETMPATPANLEFAIHLEADRLVNSFIRRDDLLSEMTVVRNEFEMGENSPADILEQRMLANAYEWHNYGKSTIGNRSDIERVPIDKLQAFYRKYYRVDNCQLVVAGKFEEAKALELVEKYFGKLKPPKDRLEETYTEEPPQDGERIVVLRRVGKVAIAAVAYHIPAGSHPDYAALEILETALTSEPSGRLYKDLVLGKLASSVSGTAYAWHDPSIALFRATVATGVDPEKVREELIQGIESLKKKPLTVEDIERARLKLLKHRELLMTQSNQIGIDLSEWGALGDWRLFFLHRDRLRQVTPADIVRVANAYFKPSNRTVGMYIPTTTPDRAQIPAAPPIKSLVDGYVSKETIAQGEAFDPTPGNLEKRVQRDVLQGGVKLAMLPKKTRGEAVFMQLNLRYGSAESLRGQREACELLGSLLTKGTRQKTRQQLQDALDKLQVQLHSSSEAGLVSFSLEGKRANLIPALGILREILREPSLPSEEFELIRRKLRQAVDRGSTDPQFMASQTIRHTLNAYPPEDVRYNPTLAERIKAIDSVSLRQVEELYSQLGAVAGECIFVGDFDPAAVKSAVGAMLDGWRPKVPYERLARKACLTPKGERKQIVEIPDKPNAVYLASMQLPISSEDPAIPALTMADFLLGGGDMSSRLGNRIREKEGLSYGVGTQLHPSAIDPLTKFVIFAICNPSNMSKVASGIMEECKRIANKGVEAKELEEGKKALLEQLKLQRGEDAALVAILAEDTFAGRTFAYHERFEAHLRELGREDVQSAIKKYLDPDKLVIIEAGDFKKSASK